MNNLGEMFSDSSFKIETILCVDFILLSRIIRLFFRFHRLKMVLPARLMTTSALEIISLQALSESSLFKVTISVEADFSFSRI